MDRRVRTILDEISADPSAVRSLADLAHSVGLSRSRLRHLIKQELGTPVSAAVRTARMELARHLLEGSFLSVKQVTYEVGFLDETHFIREFKKTYGITPGAYRRQIGSSHAEGGGRSRISRWLAVYADVIALIRSIYLLDTKITIRVPESSDGRYALNSL